MGRVAVVTGASSGMGRAIAVALLEEGYRVIGVARDFARSPIRHAEFVACPLDLSDLKALAGAAHELAASHTDAEALICCAGRGRFGSLEEFSYEQMRELVDLNFTSQAYLTRAFVPHMKSAGRGDILFMGSEAALRGSRGGAVYCASKFAVRGFAQALREECSSAGIGVTIVNPGMVRTPFFEDLDFAPGEEPDNHIEAEDVADVVVGILKTRSGTVIDEVNLSPLKRVIDFSRRKGK